MPLLASKGARVAAAVAFYGEVFGNHSGPKAAVLGIYAHARLAGEWHAECGRTRAAKAGLKHSIARIPTTITRSSTRRASLRPCRCHGCLSSAGSAGSTSTMAT